jgi:hypothetical protein
MEITGNKTKRVEETEPMKKSVKGKHQEIKLEKRPKMKTHLK